MPLLIRKPLAVCLLPAALLLAQIAVTGPALAQTAPSQTQKQTDRIAATPNLRPTTRLPGHVPAWAVPANDAGPAPADLNLRLTFVLTRSAERQAAFTQMLADLQNPNSPSFHHWLTPQQIGTLYGPTQHDLDTLTAWLTAQGLRVAETAPSHVFITVEAPASTVANALAVSFRYFNVNDGQPETSQPQANQPTLKPRLAATTDPTIPAALAPLILSISGLADTPVHPMHHAEIVPMAATQAPAGQSPQPLGTSQSSGRHYIAPNDFAVLYDLNATYQAGINGASQKIAIIGRSQVDPLDITRYEALTGLPSKLPNVIIPPAGIDPGTPHNGDQSEATLDVQRAFGTAPGAQVDLVVSATPAGASNSGLFIAAQYEVQTLLDPVMSISFGNCEANAGLSGVTLYDTLFSQAAAEGISVFVSAGDSGAAGCQAAFKPPSPTVFQGNSINYICASSYATCVGGTEFADLASPATYWSPTNGTGLLSALSYIPEGAWNESLGTNAATGAPTYNVIAGGGGASVYVAKPTWQTGAGVPADGFRDVPDVSFSASGHNGYFGCLGYAGADCINFITFFSGTSAAAPSMAAAAALLNQKEGGAQGSLNPLLYRLAANAPSAFHDTTSATSGIATCDLNTPSMCNNSTPSTTAATGPPTGVLAGYALTPGYDLATGLGSLDIGNFLSAFTNAATLSITPAAKTLTLTAGATTGNTDVVTVNSSIYAGSAALTCAVTFNGPGTAAFIPTCSLSPPSVTLASNGSASTTLTLSSTLPRALKGSTLTTATEPGAPRRAFGTWVEPSHTTTGIPHLALAIRNDPPQKPGDPHLASEMRVGSSTVATSPQTQSKLQRITTLSPIALASFFALIFLPPRRRLRAFRAWQTLPSILLLLAGLTALSACSGSSTPISPNPLLISGTNSTLSAAHATIPSQGTDTFTVVVVNSGFNTAVTPTGTVQFFQAGTAAPIATATLAAGTTTSAPIAFTSAGTYSITAAYAGDNNFSPSTSAILPITVTPTGTTSGAYTITLNAATPTGITTSTAIALTIQ